MCIPVEIFVGIWSGGILTRKRCLPSLTTKFLYQVPWRDLSDRDASSSVNIWTSAVKKLPHRLVFMHKYFILEAGLW